MSCAAPRRRPRVDPAVDLVVAQRRFPAPFDEAATPLLRQRGEFGLMSAVLRDAIRTFCRYAGVPGRRSERLFGEAASWLASSDASWLFSFENICDALDLDAAWIRGLLVRWEAMPASAGECDAPIPSVRRIASGRHAVRGKTPAPRARRRLAG
jgi:hypothetical protein